MRVITNNELSNRLYDDYEIFAGINMTEQRVRDMVGELSTEQCLRIVQCLNRINQQGIVSINAGDFSYRLSGCDKVLSLTRLSTSEALFLVCCAAEALGRYIIVSKDISQLSRNTLELFYVLFWHSDFVVLCFDDYNEARYYCNIVFGGMHDKYNNRRECDGKDSCFGE